jgi:hypothetical protein
VVWLTDCTYNACLLPAKPGPVTEVLGSQTLVGTWPFTSHGDEPTPLPQVDKLLVRCFAQYLTDGFPSARTVAMTLLPAIGVAQHPITIDLRRFMDAPQCKLPLRLQSTKHGLRGHAEKPNDR